MSNEMKNDEIESRKSLFKHHVETPTEEDIQLVEKYSWMIRKCDAYDMEYNMCRRPKGRLYQLYIDGKWKDCHEWQMLRKDCRRWIRSDNTISGANLIRSERMTFNNRIKSRVENDTWSLRRERPPANWDCPLPDYITDKYPGTLLLKEAETIEDEFHMAPAGRKYACAIM